MAPRNQPAGNPSLRNRNRVTNKTRLKVIKGNIDADPIVLDEDEERARVVSTAGVDAEDANEHHLQAVLSAASHRQTTLAQKLLDKKAGLGSSSKSSSAYIPTPDAAGVVDNHQELYPSNRWVDPASYVKYSYTVEECVPRGIQDGFTYFMDERDLEWLERNNQEARGEGTSSQANQSGATTRSGGVRTSKGKGKELEMPSPTLISEDDFELVMGLFEKLTHDNTPFLHVSFQQLQGNSIPPFSDYYDCFANDLPNAIFVGYMRPSNLPLPSLLVRIAKAIYPHWRERKIEREGHRIIPTLNFDESDIKNESYICFRRRDTKAIRKTRAAQISSAEKLSRLRAEIGSAVDLARNVMAREVHKKEAYLEAKEVWERRQAFVDLKRKYPMLGGREEEELLFDKERKKIVKEPPPLPVRIKRPGNDISASPVPVEPQMRPKDRYNSVQQSADAYAKRIKEQDHGWEEQMDTPYQQPPIAFGDKYFKPLNLEGLVASPSGRRDMLHMRHRIGRGGRRFIDRRRPSSHRLINSGTEVLDTDDRNASQIHDARQALRTSLLQKTGALTDAAKLEETREAGLNDDKLQRLEERWRFDRTGETLGADEEDRVLFDDFNPKHMRFQSQFALDNAEVLQPDNRLYIYDSQKGMHTYVNPLKQPYTTPHSRREGAYQLNRPTVAAQPPSSGGPGPSASPSNPSSPVKSGPPITLQPSKAQSSSPSRPISSALANGVPATGARSASPANAVATGAVNGVTNTQPNGQDPSAASAAVNSAPSGHVNGSVHGIATMPNGSLAGQINVNNLTSQQLQALVQKQSMQKHHANVAANLQQRNGQQPVFNQIAMNGSTGDNGSNMGNGNIVGPVNMNLKLPPQRAMQWANSGQRNQAGQMLNGADLSALQGLQNFPNIQHLANFALLQNGNVNVNGRLSPARNAHSPPNAHTHSMSPLGNAQNQTQNHASPNRNMQTPVPPSPSPLLQQLPPNLVGNVTSQNQGF